MMVNDEQIYQDMAGKVTEEDIKKVQRLTDAWKNAMDNLDGANDVRTVFLACVQTIITMGPAYCKLAAVNLIKAYNEAGEEKPYGKDE